ncbi:hypothetical protein QPK87_23810 [Kamptonema cortianum]|nr:hypothetical protein [Oscillatoria laete-virens]MDK3159577.1 hypothetical protein [Kamptonema cortianum]MDL5053287.1 hypothetical protein [Oscillatoria laete-virens NRMC-F 0139]
MKLTLLFLLSTITFIHSFPFNEDYREPPVKSPSENYAVFATVNRTDRNKPNYACVMIHLLDADGKELEVLKSKAGDVQKWALGWMTDSDVVVLYSSDVGSMAFEIVEGTLKEISPLSEDMKSRAADLKAEKYRERR